MMICTSSTLNRNNAYVKSLQSRHTSTKQYEVTSNKAPTGITQTKQSKEKLNLIHFGMNSESDDVQFSELAQKSKLFAQKKYRQAKQWIKKQSQQQSQDKKDAAVAAGVGIAAGVAAETAIGGLSGGIVGATVAAFTGYKVHKNRQQRTGLPYGSP